MKSGSEQEYIRLFDEDRTLLESFCCAGLNRVREEAFSRFKREGFPTASQEEYRYTRIAELFDYNYGVNIGRKSLSAVNPYRTFKCDLPQLGTHLHFIINDTLYTGEHPTTPLPDGVFLGTFSHLYAENPMLFERYYNRLAGERGDALSAFNTAFLQEGLCLYIPKNRIIEEPIQLVNLLHAPTDLLTHRRLLFILEEGAAAQILICDHNLNTNKYLTTQVTEAYVGENARLDLYELENSHTSNIRLSTLFVSQQACSRTHLNSTTLTNGVTRNTTRLYLEGEQAETCLNGLVTADKKQHVDNNTYIEHTVRKCTGNELYKYVLDDHSVGAFSGKVSVCPGAQQTVSRETNRNLCLNGNARMYAQPQLEIYADDVKCSHGATVGQLDENALFYMRQRGIEEKEARLLLMFSFVNEVIDTINIEALRHRIRLLVEQRFRGELDKCEKCTFCKQDIKP